jgi:polo-like kinase 1
MGAVLYALLYGRPPFETSDVKKTYKKIKECAFAFDDEVSVSNNAKNLISRLLVIDPAKRLTLEQIKSHPFLNQIKIPTSLSSAQFNTAIPKSLLDSQNRFKSTEKIS